MSALGYEAAKNNVSTFLSAHMERVQKAFAKDRSPNDPTTILSDVNGTLDEGSSVGQELDQFLSDWHRAGLPVLIASGRECPQADHYQVTSLLEKSGADWFKMKIVSLKDVRPGLVFDDDHALVNTYKASGATALDANSEEGAAFLESWVQLTEEDRQAALQPFVDIHQRAFPQMKVETWTDPGAEAMYNKVAYLFDVDPFALIELKWTLDGLQPQVYEDYIPVLKHQGLMNEDGTVPDIVKAIIDECLYQDEQSQAWGLDPLPPTVMTVTMAGADEPVGGTNE